MTHILLLLLAAVAIYLACEWFVNAVEWLGARLRIGTIAVGTILAAIGTALPESVVTLVAVTFGGGTHGKAIGVGAAMGGPLVLATLAYGVTGVMLFTRRPRRVGAPSSAGRPVETPETPESGRGPTPEHDDAHAGADQLAGTDTRRLARDQTWFLAIFVVKVTLGLVAFAVKPWLGVLFFATYAMYFRRELTAGGTHSDEADLEPLKFRPRLTKPPTWAVATQTLVTLAIIFGASQLFVAQLEWAGPAIGLSPTVVALLLSPVATELPEVTNAVIWVRQGKTQLALANISGAMMIQATVPSGLGLLFTSWSFDAPLIASGATTMAAIVYLLVCLRTGRLTHARLAGAVLFYGAFGAALAGLL